MATAVLALIYNHRFEKNIDRLSRIYSDRFTDVLHLVPFTTSTRSDVIPVFESSFQFQGYVAQALPALLRIDADYVVFAGDDLLLAPQVNEGSLEATFGVGTDTAFIKEWTPVPDSSFWWWNFWAGVDPFFSEGWGTQWRSELPPPQEAVGRMQRHGYRDRPLSVANFRRGTHVGVSKRAGLQSAGKLVAGGMRIDMPYPLAMGYSDLVIVPRAHLPLFARLCGVMAAMRAHVEVAIPTALGLSLPHIATEASAPAEGVEYWEDDVKKFEDSMNHDLTGLERQLSRSGHAWVHPVKLSRWK